MSTGHVLILGAIAGGTIFLGLPIGRRVRNLNSMARAGLSALATGILLFLPLGRALGRGLADRDELTTATGARSRGYSAVGVAGFALGMMGLVYYSEWMKRQSRGARRRSSARGRRRSTSSRRRLGRGHHRPAAPRAPDRGRDRRPQLRRGPRDRPGGRDRRASLAVTLIVGFALHNATEGFGICGPMSGEGTRPTLGVPRAARADRRRADLLRHRARPGVDERGRVGRVLRDRGRARSSTSCRSSSTSNRKYGHTVLVTWLILAGLVLGFATDFVVTASGI